MISSRRSAGCRDDVVQQVEGRGVRPLQIIQHDRDVVVSRHALKPADGRVEQQEPLTIGVVGGF